MRHPHLVIALLAVALAATTFNGFIGPNGDDAAYVIFAQGIMSGHGLAWMSYPVPEPSGYRTFTLPLLLVPFERFVPGQYLLYKLVPWTAFVVLAVAMTRLFRTPFRTWWLLLTLFNPHSIEYSTQILTEIPYLALSLLLLAGLHSWSRHGGWQGLPLVLGLYFLIHLKELGYALLGALLLFSLLHRRRRGLLIVAAVLLLLGADFLFLRLRENIYLDLARMHNQYEPARGSMSPAQYAIRCGKRVLEYPLNRFPDYFLLPYFHDIDPHLPDGRVNPWFAVKALPGLLLALLLLRGFILRCRRAVGLLELYLALYTLILIAWQSGLPRYLIPVAPLLYLCLLDGLRGLPYPRVTRLALLALVVLTLAEALQVQYTLRTQPLLPHWQTYYRASTWAGANLPDTAVIACRKPGLTYLLAGRHTAPYPETPHPAALHAAVLHYGITHILVDELATGGLLADRYLRPALAAGNLATRAVYSDGKRTELREVLAE